MVTSKPYTRWPPACAPVFYRKQYYFASGVYGRASEMAMIRNWWLWGLSTMKHWHRMMRLSGLRSLMLKLLPGPRMTASRVGNDLHNKQMETTNIFMVWQHVVLKRILATINLSVCPYVYPSVTTWYQSKPRWNTESRVSPCNSVKSLVFLWQNFVSLVKEIPLQRGCQKAYPPKNVIKPSSTRLACKQADLLLIRTGAGGELSCCTLFPLVAALLIFYMLLIVN